MQTSTESLLRLKRLHIRALILASSLFFTLLSVCVPVLGLHSIIKFADDSMVVVLTSDDDKTTYREEVKHLAMGCAVNNLYLNTRRTKKLIVDYWRTKRSLHQWDIEIRCMVSFRFLCVYI